MKKAQLFSILFCIYLLFGNTACKKERVTIKQESSLNMSIHQVDLAYCPNGTHWDTDNSPPDPVLVINKGCSASTLNYINNQVAPYISNTTGQNMVFSLTSPLIIDQNNTNDYWTISIWDYDGSTGDYLGSLLFMPNHIKENLPNSFTLEGNGLKLIIHVTWTQ